MANTYVENATGTLSRLIPASRSVTFRPLGQLRNRTVPAPCPGASKSSQSSGSPEQYRVGALVNEMRTFELNYTACVRSQDLPPNTRELYRLVARLAGLAANGSDEHPFTPTEASNAVRCLDQYVRETASNTNIANLGFSRMAQDTSLFRFHAQLGDFSGFICKALKNSKHPLISNKPWTLVVLALNKEDEDQITWEASDQTSPRPFGPTTEALRDRVNDLQVAGWNDLDLEIALLAARSYARRNFICESLRPGRLKEFPRTWDQHIRKENGEWKDAKRPAGQAAGVPALSSRPSHSTLRSSMDIGKFRPPGLAGPPPLNVSYDSAAFRRHSVDEPRGVKRPAMEQPVDHPRKKRVAVSEKFDTRTEPQQDTVSDKDELEIAKSLAAVHAIYDEWRQVSPVKFLTMLSGLRAQLTESLKKVKGAVEKTASGGSTTELTVRKKPK